MKLTRYTKFTGDLSTSFDLEDLMNALSDFFLDSGLQDPFSQFENAGLGHIAQSWIGNIVQRMKD